MAETKFVKRGIFRLPAGVKYEGKHYGEAGERFYGRMVRNAKLLMRAQGMEITVEGAEKLPLGGGALLAFNHTGYYDFIFGGIPAHINGRRLVRFMAKKELFNPPVVGKWMYRMEHIPVDRTAGAGSTAFELAVEDLKNGRLVGIFPEATVSRSFELKEFKNGAARIATTADVPLIPVIIWGSQRIWTKDHPKNLGRSNTPIWIRVGDPVDATGDPDVAIERLRNVMKEMLVSVRADYAAEYGPIPDGEYWMPAALGGSAPDPERARLLELEERERRQAKREKKAAAAARKADLKADEVLRSSGILGRLRLRAKARIQERKEKKADKA